LIEFFSRFPLEKAKTKPIRYTRKIYAGVSILVICTIWFSISISKTKIAQAKIITQTFVQKEFKYDKISGIFVDLLRGKSTVDLTTKHIVFNLKTKTIEKIIEPYLIELSDEEKNLAIEILHKGKYPFFIYQDKADSKTIVYVVMRDPLMLDEKVDLFLEFLENNAGLELKHLFDFYSTDEIVQMKEYQYPDTNSKEAYVELKSDRTKGYKAILVVDLEKKEIKGPHVDRIDTNMTKKKLR
jgi:hypothetical protein